MAAIQNSIVIEIGNYLVSSEIITEYFSCNYEEGGGACCIIGDSGAPLEKEEEALLIKDYSNFEKYMAAPGVAAVKEQGYGVIDSDGDFVTPLVNRKAECAYAFFDKQFGCMCAIERGFRRGECSFKKPKSCRLYPIRVSRLSSGYIALNLHRWTLCNGAFEKGAKEKVPVYKFLREPLIDVFGEEFYSALEISSKSLLASK